MLMHPASISTVKFIHQSWIYEDIDRCKKKKRFKGLFIVESALSLPS